MLEKLLVALVVGLLGLLPAVLQWISGRSQNRSRDHRVARLSTELEFLERWANLSRVGSDDEQTQKAGTSPLAVQQELERILAEYRSVREGELEDQIGPAQVSFWKRALLLFRPSTGQGWLIHTTFYCLIIFVTYAIVSDLLSPTFDPETGENELPYLIIGLVVIFGPLFFFLQRAAVRLREEGLKKRPGATNA